MRAAQALCTIPRLRGHIPVFGSNTEKYPSQRMTDIEDAEDAEIQRQLLEAKQRIAYLRRQVEREQKLRQEQELEEKQQHGSKTEESETREQKYKGKPEEKKWRRKEDSVPATCLVIREDEITKVANLQHRLNRR